MADKSVGELIAAQSVTPTDLFVLEQNGTAKKLTGQILENWLVSFADGHGGIQSIVKKSTSGLVDTYRITLADTTTFDFMVTNGKSIKSISKASTSGLVDTYRITFNDSTSSTFTVTNGAKGDKGDNAYIWIKYASQEPTESSHSMGDIPDDWIGIYSGNASTAPTDWKQYKWFKHKGEKGDTGNPATLANKSVTYQIGDSGTIIPSGSWGNSIPVVSQGKYLWTKTEVRFNTGDPIVSYSVSRMGIDGSGSVSSVCGVSPDSDGNVTLTAADVGAIDGSGYVSSVCGVSPDSDGNVTLTAADVGALAVSGGEMTGELRMNGQPISGLNDPTEDTQAANKGYVDELKDNLADAWTSGKTYAVGYYCISGNQLYKCKTAHTAGSSFNSDYWDAVSVAGEIGPLKSRKANIYTNQVTNTDHITISIVPAMESVSSVSFFINLADWVTGDAYGAVGVFSRFEGGHTGTVGLSRILSDPDHIIASAAVSIEALTLTVQLDKQYSYLKLYYIY